jgi:hypothetical protein
MLRLSGTSVYGLTGSSHRHHAAITIALGFTTSSVAATSAVRTVASMRHAVNQMQRIHSTASSTGATTVVTLVSLPMPLSSSRRQSSASAAGDHGVPNANPDHEDLYARLGLTRGCDKNDVKSNYRKLAKFYHPDFNRNDKRAEEKFKRVTEAYEVLSDNDARKRYDSTGRTPNAAEGGGKWGYTGYSYTYSNTGLNPVRFYLGVAATAWLLVMIVAWGYQGTLSSNLVTFVAMLTIVTFLGRIAAAALLFYLYAPSSSGASKRGVSDASTVVMHVYVAPHAGIAPTRTLRLTGVDRVAMPTRHVDFLVKWDGMPNPEVPLVLSSKLGSTSVSLPPVVGEMGLFITAKLIDGGKVISQTQVSLA